MPEVPRLVSIPVNVHSFMEQRVQCKLPTGVVWDVSWDRALSKVTLFVEGQSYIIDCSHTPIIPKSMTLRQVIDAIGYNIQYYLIENIWCENEGTSVDALIDSPVETLPLLQFDLLSPYI